MSTPMPMSGPPPGLAQLPPGPPGMGAPPMGGDPVTQLSTMVGGLQQQQAQNDAAATGALMVLGQLLSQQASPQAIDAQSSPGPMVPQAPGAVPGQ